MNIHPLIVHFPVALLSLYAVCELIRFKKVTVQPFWFYLKATLSILGSMSAVLAIITGGFVETMFKDIPLKNAIVPVHEMWAVITLVIFGILALSYFVAWLQKPECAGVTEKCATLKKISTTLSPLSSKILNTNIALVLAVIGIITITITGGLGGAMVHGIDVDPIVTFIYHLFF